MINIFYCPAIYITNIISPPIFHKTNTVGKQRGGNGLFLHPNLLNNGSVGLWHARRWKSNKFTLHGHLSRNNIKLFPDSPLKSIKMQSNSQDTISNEGSAACRTKYEGRAARAAFCYIPASIQPNIYDKNDPFITPTNAVNILYRLVVFRICNRLPAKHDNKSCGKGNCVHTQLGMDTKLQSLFDVQ